MLVNLRAKFWDDDCISVMAKAVPVKFLNGVLICRIRAAALKYRGICPREGNEVPIGSKKEGTDNELVHDCVLLLNILEKTVCFKLQEHPFPVFVHPGESHIKRPFAEQQIEICDAFHFYGIRCVPVLLAGG